MAKKDLTKIDLELEEAKKKVASLENERKLAEENIQKQIGKIYVQIQLKKDKTQTYEKILDDLKTELTLIREEEKAQREAAKKNVKTWNNNLHFSAEEASYHAI
ncbi:TPA: hypothetical protein ACGUEU_001305 [Streptococcus agalactiae]